MAKLHHVTPELIALVLEELQEPPGYSLLLDSLQPHGNNLVVCYRLISPASQTEHRVAGFKIHGDRLSPAFDMTLKS